MDKAESTRPDPNSDRMKGRGKGKGLDLSRFFRQYPVVQTTMGGLSGSMCCRTGAPAQGQHIHAQEVPDLRDSKRVLSLDLLLVGDP